MFRTWWTGLAIATMVLVASGVGAQPGAIPQSLQKELPVLYPQGSALQTAAPEGKTPCGAPLGPTSADPAPSSFTLAQPPNVNGTYRPLSTWIAEIELGAPEGGNPYISGGYTVNVTLTVAGITMYSQQRDVNPSSSPEDLPPFSFESPSGPVNTSGKAITLTVTLSPDSPDAAPDQRTRSNAAIQCGSGTRIQGTSGGPRIALGAYGEGDIDQDGIPNSEDPDRDGDGAPDAEEKALVCPTAGETLFEEEPADQPGDHDGDGFSDVEECQKGSDPFHAFSVPPPITPFPWARLIFLAVLVLFIVLALLNFFVWGRVADLVVLTAPQLIIPRGGSARYDLEARGRRKKGREVRFQLQARGLPEGWDTKLSKDHVVLGPQGSDKNVERFTLTVEAPEHEDPESAVISVVAVPLSGSGRKDTFKTAARAKTITSINVPPNAKVPVKRGEDPQLLTEAEMAKREAALAVAPPPSAAAAEPTPAPEEAPAGPWREKDRPVLDIEGVGETYAAKLEKMGITTVQTLHAADTDQIARRTGAPETTVRQWQAMAELIDVDGVGPQVAELLVRSGIYSISQLAKSEPKELVKQIEATNEGREVQIQGGPAGTKSAKAWIKAAQKHPLADASPRFVPPAPSQPETQAEPPAPGEEPAQEKPKRGLFGRKKKEAEPAPEPLAPSEAAPEEAPAPAEAEEPKEKKRFGLFGRKKTAADVPAPEAPAEAPAAAPEAPAPAAPAKPNLQVGGLQHAPPTFRPGDEVRSTVTVTNQGGTAHTIKLSLFVNDALADAQTATVKPGKSKEVKFKWTAQDRNKLNIRGELVQS